MPPIKCISRSSSAVYLALSTANRQWTRYLPHGKSFSRKYRVPITYSSISRRHTTILNSFPGKLTRLINCVVRKTVWRFPANILVRLNLYKDLRQDDERSCLLFYIALDGVMRRAGCCSWITIFNGSGQSVCFAGDMDVIDKTSTKLCTKCTLNRTLIKTNGPLRI